MRNKRFGRIALITSVALILTTGQLDLYAATHSENNITVETNTHEKLIMDGNAIRSVQLHETGIQSDNTYTEGDYVYSVNSENMATIIKYNGVHAGSLVIPSELGGYKVTVIGKNVFAEENKNIIIQNPPRFTGTLTIPNSVVKIEITRVPKL